MNLHRAFGAGCIGAACAILQPDTLRSVAATVLLVVAVNLYLWNVRTRP